LCGNTSTTLRESKNREETYKEMFENMGV